MSSGPVPPTSLVPEFAFPFPPYSIQTEFMRSLYGCLDRGDFGIFESPTGTGKSMSLICGALTWFLQHEKKRKEILQKKWETLANDDGDADDDDWFAEAVKKKKENEEKLRVKKELDALAEKESRMEELRRRRKTVQRSPAANQLDKEFEDLFAECEDVQQAVRRELAINAAQKSGEIFDAEDEEILVEEYVSDSEEDGGGGGDNGKKKGRKKWNQFDDEDEEENEDFSVRVSHATTY